LTYCHLSITINEYLIPTYVSGIKRFYEKFEIVITKALNWLILILNLIAFAFLLPKKLIGGDGIEYKDLITIILTALAVMIAVGTVVIAIMAIWGYKSISDEMKKMIELDLKNTKSFYEAELNRIISSSKSALLGDGEAISETESNVGSGDIRGTL